MRVLVVGRSGQVATELRARLPAAGHEVLALEPPELDLARPETVAAAILRHRPEAVVNAAAYTAVDRAEEEPERAFAVNAAGPAALGEAASRAGIPVVHFSTDYVFDGCKGAPYAETDEPLPLGVYGASKLEGERRLHAACPRAVTLRTAWVCSPHGGNFVRTMLRLAAERPEIRVVADQHGAPTFADDLAEAVIALLPRLAVAPEGDPAFGVFHFTGAPHTTWHGFAAAILDGAAARGRRVPPLYPIATADYPTRARRPADGRLDCRRATEVLGLPPPDWRAGLARCLDALLVPEGAHSA
ncbi:dTDP-4-dehydrorhamnose reductase [Crenalkalicoccus roseus]|uniref:dTDP-4-dehydrorhamnose reductase n=1 Tax=Crenalkalicoccus roseus TaxID=1485588 RepID=UPI0010802529|nr:dTDP-4-dehydrorhamnose reductase [Crenalkalicoccus roseus]